ncbi:MAG: hypothetical protein ACK4UK_07225, partial [Flavobacterium sp.]
MKYNSFVPLIIGLITMVSCQRELQLSQGDYTVLSEMTDHTPVYLFFEDKNGDTLIELNRKN